MADYTNSKTQNNTSLYPEAVNENGWDEVEPLITAAKVRRIHLFGIPLVSFIKNPMTGKPDVLDDPLIDEFIKEAIALAELESQVKMFPRQITEKAAFDKNLYESFGYMVLRQRPVSSIESLTVSPANEGDVFQIPNEWIDTGYLHQGQINMIPLTIALKTGTTVPLSGSPAGIAFLALFGYSNWIPSYWRCTYTVGFKDGKFPRIINQYIGVIAAMEILSMLATTYSRSTSTSLGIDGLSQSISTPGPDLFETRLKFLGDKRGWLQRKIQRLFNLGLTVDNV